MRISAKHLSVALLLVGAATAFSPQPSAIVRSRSTALQEKKDATQAVMEEANDALTSVGWAPPTSDAELTSEDPFVQQIDASIQQDMGVGLEELLNPAKVSQ